MDIKVEANHKTASAPRVVQNPAFDISVASGVLAKTLELLFRKCKWYNPHRKMHEIAELVQECYRLSSEIEVHLEGGGMRAVDYTSADDTHCRHSNRILRRIIEYFICDADRKEALDIYDSCFHMTLQCGKKVKSSGWKNASGTGLTTILNTVVFALRELETTMVAMIFRAMQDEGDLIKGEYIVAEDGADMPYPVITHNTFLYYIRHIQEYWQLEKVCDMARCLGYRPGRMPNLIDLAYTWIGPKFGDDALDPATPYCDNKVWKCAMLYVDKADGFIRKLETASARNEKPVEYLSRIYPCPLRSPSSFCKVEKALDKLSIAMGRDRERYILKLRGYDTTDHNTPVVGAFLEALSHLYKFEMTRITDKAELDRLYEHERDLYYKVINGPFPYDGNSREEQYSAVGEIYGMSGNELDEFDARLRKQTTWAEIQAMMLPAKIISETTQDPLGLEPMVDPPGVARAPHWSTSKRGQDARLIDDRTDAAKAGPSCAARDEAARSAFV